jgi:hypothetical protein
MLAALSAFGRALSHVTMVCQTVIGLLDSVAQILSGKLGENAAVVLAAVGAG